MCAGLMVNARVGRCVYGAADAKAGALGSLYDLNADSRLNHRFNVRAGVLADECREVLSSYFSGLRGTDCAGCGCGADLGAYRSCRGARVCRRGCWRSGRLWPRVPPAPAVCCWRSTPLKAAFRVRRRRKPLPKACAVARCRAGRFAAGRWWRGDARCHRRARRRALDL